MQVNRERLLELAIQGGATIDNAERVAIAWEKWVKDAKDSWPTPFDGEVSNPSPIKVIDWSKKQLVIATKNGCIVETTGAQDESYVGSFTGYEIFPNGEKSDISSSYWHKNKFSYYGEIPDEPKNTGNPEQEIDWNRPQLVMDTETELVVKVNKDVNQNMFLGELYPKMAGTVGSEKIFFKRPCVYYGEIEPKNPGEQVPPHLFQPVPIDWSRPQLVIDKDLNRVVQTDGNHIDDEFSGTIVQKGDGMWDKGEFVAGHTKSNYVYHGEILEEPKTLTIEELAKETILKCKDSCYSGWGREASNELEGDYGRWSDWEEVLVKFGNETLQNAQKISATPEPKTTGLNFLEAVNVNINGHSVKRDGWSGSWMPWVGGKSDEYARIPLCDILATDWQIIEP